MGAFPDDELPDDIKAGIAKILGDTALGAGTSNQPAGSNSGSQRRDRGVRDLFSDFNTTDIVGSPAYKRYHAGQVPPNQ